MRSPLAAWNDFWFAEASPISLAVFRILFALALLQEIGTSRALNIHAVADDTFHLPYLVALPLLPEGFYGFLYDLQIPLAILLVLGVASRATCGVLLAIQGYIFFADQLNFRNHPYLFLLLLLLLALSPAREALSLAGITRALRRRRPWTEGLYGPDRPLTFQRMIQVQLCITYVFAALHKLHPAYLDGGVLDSLMKEGVLPALDLPLPVLTTLAGLSVAIELALPIALWFEKTKLPAIAVGVVFHATIAYGMDVHAFSIVMISSYVLFLDPRTVPGFFQRIFAAPPRDTHEASL